MDYSQPGASEASPLHTFLRGIKVLDLSTYLPGPFATLMLADMGAEVLKIEPPAGDPMLHVGPKAQGDAGLSSVYYNAVNAGKTVLRLDLKEQAAKDRLIDLVRGYDVLVEGFRPGVMQRIGLGPKELLAVNSRLIYCSLSGYGESGPLSSAAGHDINYVANSGITHRNGKDAPVFYDPPVADLSSALFTIITILGALRKRDQDGAGCRLDIGIADAPMPLQLLQIAAFGADRQVPQRSREALNGGSADYQVYETRDKRHVVLGALGPRFWTKFCTEAGHLEWLERISEPLPQLDLIAEVAAFFSTMTASECHARFDKADCCVTIVVDLAEAMSSPHTKTRDLVRADGHGGVQALFPARVDGCAPGLRQPVQVQPARDAIP